jgi:hypothetical protein
MSHKKIISFPLEECCICFCNMDKYNEIISLNCNHTFHNECLLEWCKTKNNTTETLNNIIIINGLCPICNSPFINSIYIENNIITKKCCCIIQ